MKLFLSLKLHGCINNSIEISRNGSLYFSNIYDVVSHLATPILLE